MTDTLGGMETALNLHIMLIAAASLLGLILSMLLTYWVIRLAVSHALRAHHYWTLKQ